MNKGAPARPDDDQPEVLLNAVDWDWNILRAKSRRENLVHRSLTERGIRCFIPKRRVAAIGRIAQRELLVPLFPGYVFFQQETVSHRELQYVAGSCGIVSFNNRLASISNGDLLKYSLVTREAGHIELHDQLYSGLPVTIVAGPLAGMEGEMVRLKHGVRVVLNVHFIGKSICVEVDVDSIRPRVG